MRAAKHMRDSRVEMLKFVFPEHTNPRGKLYGGRMVKWVMEAALMAASRHSNALATLASMEDLDFLAPVEAGEIVSFRAQVEYAGRTSMEVGVEVKAENPSKGIVKYPCTAHLTYVAVDDRLHPIEVPALVPEFKEEDYLYQAAQQRREQRKARIERRNQMAGDVGFQIPAGPRVIEVAREVFPEDTLIHNYADAGSVMLTLDVTGGILCARYSRRVAVTASIDAVDFYSPLMLGEIMVVKAALNSVGHTSMEVGMKVIAENPFQRTLRHTTTAYFTFVAIDDNGKPAPVPAYLPQTDDEKRRADEGAARHRIRLSRSKPRKG